MFTSDLSKIAIQKLVQKDKVEGLSAGELKRLKRGWKAYLHFVNRAKKVFPKRTRYNFYFYSKAEVEKNEKSYAKYSDYSSPELS